MTTTPTRISNPEIQEMADQLSLVFRKRQADPDDPKLDLVPILAALKADVTSGNRKESSEVEKDGTFHIYLPQMTSNRRDRFTICHEIGHYFLHYVIVDTSEDRFPLRFGRGERNKAETQANVFASSFLMPHDIFKTEYDRLQGDNWQVAEAFGVSPDAASVRAQVLGLVL